MSVVIVGGHDRMVCQYKKICKGYKCKAKVFTQMSANLSEQIGTPDLPVSYTHLTSCISYADSRKCVEKHVGKRIFFYQKSGNDYFAIDHRTVVFDEFWME